MEEDDVKLRGWLGLGCIAVGLATMAGCGLPVDASPVPIPSSQLPPALSEPSATQPTVNPQVGHAGCHLPDRARRRPAHPGDQLRSQGPARDTPEVCSTPFARAPPESEIDLDITTAIPPSANLISGGVDADGLLRSSSTRATGRFFPSRQALYFAQIVWTVTSPDLPYVRGVAFEYQDAFVEPEIGNGSQWTQYVVHRSEYEQMAPQKP